MLLVSIITHCAIITVAYCSADYNKSRNTLREFERQSELGHEIVLSQKEEEVNKLLLKLKYEELEAGFKDPAKFLAAQHFFVAKPGIEASSVFKFIRRMPKGASLHSHNTAMVSEEYLMNLTYWKGLHACRIDDGLMFNFHPKNECDWKLLQNLREENPDYDKLLRTKLTLFYNDPIHYKNVNSVWKDFRLLFHNIFGMYSYVPVFKDYFRQVLQELHDDNVMYVEFRSTLSPLYDANRSYKASEMINMYINVLKKFKKENPDFLNARIIYSPSRNNSDEKVEKFLPLLNELKAAFPNFIAGFDLVGQEDVGRPLMDFVHVLKNISTPTFYHAGETKWYGASTDLNLYDAVILGAKRIGHGYAITKHPAVLKKVKEEGIAIEVCPISNQVLRLVQDLRNHPATYLFANDYPVVICNDDPSFWGTTGLSYDWYYAFMAFSSWDSGLRTLKKLALNSINYSVITGEEKLKAMKLFQRKWDEFIDNELKG